MCPEFQCDLILVDFHCTERIPHAFLDSLSRTLANKTMVQKVARGVAVVIRVEDTILLQQVGCGR